VREIAKQAHATSTDLNKIRMKLTGEINEDPQKKKSLSIPSQAFELFLEGKSIVHMKYH
jgi:hypothetical protein